MPESMAMPEPEEEREAEHEELEDEVDTYFGSGIGLKDDVGAATVAEAEPSRISGFRVEVDGKWEISDMHRYFKVLDDLYNFNVYVRSQVPFRLHLLDFPRHFAHEQLDFLSMATARVEHVRSNYPTFFDSFDVLQVRRIQYGSKGFTDFAGVGTIVGHITHFILEIVRIFRRRKLDDQDVELKKQEAAFKKQEVKSLKQKIELQKQEVEMRKLEVERARIQNALRNVELQKEKLEVVNRAVQIMRDSGFGEVETKDAMRALDDVADQLGVLVLREKLIGVQPLAS